MHKRTLVLVLLPFLACASNKTAVTGTGDPSTPSATAEAPSASASTSASVAAMTSAAPTVSAAPTATEAPDPCGPISAGFETKVRPQVKTCFFDALGKNPTLTGNVHITLHVDPTGKLKSMDFAESKELGKDAVACMTKAIKAGAFDGKDCAGKGLTLAMAFGNAARPVH